MPTTIAHIVVPGRRSPASRRRARTASRSSARSATRRRRHRPAGSAANVGRLPGGDCAPRARSRRRHHRRPCPVAERSSRAVLTDALCTVSEEEFVPGWSFKSFLPGRGCRPRSGRPGVADASGQRRPRRGAAASRRAGEPELRRPQVAAEAGILEEGARRALGEDASSRRRVVEHVTRNRPLVVKASSAATFSCGEASPARVRPSASSRRCPSTRCSPGREGRFTETAIRRVRHRRSSATDRIRDERARWRSQAAYAAQPRIPST